MNRIWGLDLLRATAVMAVLLSHVSMHSQDYFLLKLFPLGPILGVELFFVLSGFLIGQILIKQIFSSEFRSRDALYFMKRRWFRTLPNYYLFFVVMLFLQWNVGKDHILAFVTFMQNPLSKPVAGFYGVTWSLTVEEIFYVSFPLLLVALRSTVRNSDGKILLAIVIFIVFPVLLRFMFFMDIAADTSTEDHRKAALMRLDSIAYGVLMAYVKTRAQPLWQRLSKQRLLLLLPFWYLFIFNQFPKLGQQNWDLVYFPVCSFTMALMIPYFDSISSYKGLIEKPVTFIAKISYSLYLCHIPIIIVSNQFVDIKSVLSGNALNLFYILASILAAYIVHVLWEKPMTDLRQYRWATKGQPH